MQKSHQVLQPLTNNNSQIAISQESSMQYGATKMPGIGDTSHVYKPSGIAKRDSLPY